MPVRTTRIDVPALARSAGGPTALRGRPNPYGGGGAGAPGYTPPPVSPFTGYVFEPNGEDGIVEGTAAFNYVGRFLAEPAGAQTYELVDDLGGAISTSPDGGAPFVIDDDGYLLLFTTYIPLPAGPQTFTVRALLGMASEDFTVEIDVAAMEPYVYTYTYSPSQFDTNAVEGQGVADLFPDDTRISVTHIELIDDAGGRFSVVNNVNIVRTAVAVADGPYTLTANITFSDGHVEEDSSFTLTAFSIG